jgi:IclR family transcriptional regulator, acetate operon repressor
MKDSNKQDEVGVLIKSMNLLVCLAEAPLTVVELSERTGISKPTVYRILNTLDSGGFVDRDASSRKYILGPALIGLGRATRNSAELIRYVRPTLMELRKKYNETVNLGVLSYGKVIYLDTLESGQQLRVTVPMTIENNAHTTALGKAILAAMSEDSALRIISSMYASKANQSSRYTEPEFIENIRSSRQQGFAIDNEDDAVGFRCVAAPIFSSNGDPIAAISISAPTTRVSLDELVKIGNELVLICNNLKRANPPRF